MYFVRIDRFESLTAAPNLDSFSPCNLQSRVQPACEYSPGLITGLGTLPFSLRSASRLPRLPVRPAPAAGQGRPDQPETSRGRHAPVFAERGKAEAHREKDQGSKPEMNDRQRSGRGVACTPDQHPGRPHGGPPVEGTAVDAPAHEPTSITSAVSGEILPSASSGRTFRFGLSLPAPLRARPIRGGHLSGSDAASRRRRSRSRIAISRTGCLPSPSTDGSSRCAMPARNVCSMSVAAIYSPEAPDRC